jgi:rhodanese-related sulfurtransferase
MFIFDQKINMQFLSASELNLLLKQSDEYIILDIRESYEFEVCNLNSLNIPMGELIDRKNELPVNKKIVLMCRSGKRAEAAANLLSTEFNMSNIIVLSGGIVAWRDAVEPNLNLD